MWRRFQHNQRGNVVITFALVLPVLLCCGALAVDEASLYHERRIAQSTIDLAAISASRDPAHAEQIVRTILVEHGLESDGVETAPFHDENRLQVQTGTYTPDPGLSPQHRFDPNGANINAVRVNYRKTGTLYFAGNWARPPQIAVAATASITPEVAFSVGTRLAALNGGLVNAVLGGLLGTELSLDVMSYQALLDADVDMFRFLDALALEMELTALSYNEILDAHPSSRQVATALSGILNGSAALAASEIAEGATGATFHLSELLNLGGLGGIAPGDAPSGWMANISALELLTATAALSDGTHQLALDLTTGLPGLANINAQVAIGAPSAHAWFTLGQPGAIARSAQTRVQLEAEILGGSVTHNAAIRLPIYVEMAYAEAVAISATCPTTGSSHGTAQIDTKPGIVRLALGTAPDQAFLDFGRPPSLQPARLVSLPLLRITGAAALDVGAVTPERLHFSSSDIGNGTIHTARTSTVLRSAASSLLDNLDLNVNVAGLGLGAGPIGPAVSRLIAPVIPSLDATLNALLNTLGLALGEADVRVYKVACLRPVLVG